MINLKRIYGKIRNGTRELLIKTGLYNLASKVYPYFVGLTELNANRTRKKRERGWIDKRYIKLKELKDIHAGERCFIVCTGPSLTVDDVNRLKNEYTFSMNSIIKIFNKTDWRPTYYVIADSVAENMLSKDPAYKLLKNRMVSNVIARQANLSENDVVYPITMYDFFKDGKPKHFSNDIYNMVYTGATIVYDIMQIAAYMGFKKIYLLGCDCNYRGKKAHSNVAGYDKEFDFIPSKVETLMMESYKVAKKHCEASGIKIYNATRGGMLEVFERVDFDSLFEDKP